MEIEGAFTNRSLKGIVGHDRLKTEVEYENEQVLVWKCNNDNDNVVIII